MENPLKIDPKRDQKNDRRLEYVLGRLRENLGGFWRISGGSGGGEATAGGRIQVP